MNTNCPHCGQPYPNERANYCRHCGTSRTQAATEQSAMSPPPKEESTRAPLRYDSSGNRATPPPIAPMDLPTTMTDPTPQGDQWSSPSPPSKQSSFLPPSPSEGLINFGDSTKPPLVGDPFVATERPIVPPSSFSAQSRPSYQSSPNQYQPPSYGEGSDLPRQDPNIKKVVLAIALGVAALFLVTGAVIFFATNARNSIDRGMGFSKTRSGSTVRSQIANGVDPAHEDQLDEFYKSFYQEETTPSLLVSQWIIGGEASESLLASAAEIAQGQDDKLAVQLLLTAYHLGGDRQYLTSAGRILSPKEYYAGDPALIGLASEALDVPLEDLDWVDIGKIRGLSQNKNYLFLVVEMDKTDSKYYETNLNEGIIQLDPRGFYGLTWIDLMTVPLEKDRPWFSLQQLESVMAFDHGLEDLTFFEILEKMTHLETGGASLKESYGLQKMSNLSTLLIRESGITKLDLSANKSLRYLELWDCNDLTDLEFLEQVPGLWTFALDNDQITDFSPLEYLTDLHSLSLYHTQIKNINFVANHPGIAELYLISNSNLKSIAPASHLTTLCSVSLDGQLEGLELLQNQKELYSLRLENPKDLRVVGRITSLKYLELANLYQVESFEPLGALTNLVSLSFDTIDWTLHRTNEIVSYNSGGSTYYPSLSFLGNLTQLKLLEFGKGSQFYGDASALFTLSGLESLIMDGGRYNFPNGLDFRRLEQLDYLFIDAVDLVYNVSIQSDGFITNLDYDTYTSEQLTDSLSGCIGISRLSLYEMGIENLEFLTEMKELTMVRLSDNYITDLSPLLTLPVLEEVLVAKNPLERGEIASLEDRGIVVFEDSDTE